MPVTVRAVNRSPPELGPEPSIALGFDDIWSFRHLISGSLAFALPALT